MPEMMPVSRLTLRAAALLLPLAARSAAAAAPTSVTLTPPDGARFLEGQRFDIRVEGKGTGPFRATLTLDGAPLAFTSGAQNTTATDGISSRRAGAASTCAASRSTRRAATRSRPPSPTRPAPSRSTSVVRDRRRRRPRPVKNVIILLGDGMGVAHRTAARLVKYGVTAGQPNGYLAMDRFPGTGLVTTHSLNSIVTDSAPGHGLLRHRQPRQNGQEGVYPAHVTNPFFYPRVEYLAEYLHRLRGTSLGIVSTADVEDATPAANAVHTGNRNAGTGHRRPVPRRERGSTGPARCCWAAGAAGSCPRRRSSARAAAPATTTPSLPADLLAGLGLPAAARARRPEPRPRRRLPGGGLHLRRRPAPSCRPRSAARARRSSSASSATAT